jgi:hypothetical protein
MLDYDVGRYPRMVAGNPAWCAYCGAEAECRDHVLPFSWCGKVPSHIANERLKVGPQVHACNRCNGALGSKMFNTFGLRALWLSNEYAAKSEKAGAEWTDAAIGRLDYPLASFVEMRRDIHRELRRRSNYFNSSEYLEAFEGLLYEPMLDRNHPKFREQYYGLFRNTIDEVKRHLDSRYVTRKAWARGAETID